MSELVSQDVIRSHEKGPSPNLQIGNIYENVGSVNVDNSNSLQVVAHQVNVINITSENRQLINEIKPTLSTAPLVHPSPLSPPEVKTPSWDKFLSLIQNIKSKKPDKIPSFADLSSTNISAADALNSSEVSSKHDIDKLLCAWAALCLATGIRDIEERCFLYGKIFVQIIEKINILKSFGEDLHFYVVNLFFKIFDDHTFTFSISNTCPGANLVLAWYYYCRCCLYSAINDNQNIIKYGRMGVKLQSDNSKVFGMLYHIIGLACWRENNVKMEEEMFSEALKAYNIANDWKETDEAEKEDCKMRVRNNLNVIKLNEIITEEMFIHDLEQFQTFKKKVFDMIDSETNPNLKVIAMKSSIGRCREIVENLQKNQKFNILLTDNVLQFLMKIMEDISTCENAKLDLRMEMKALASFSIGLLQSQCSLPQESIDSLEKSIKIFDEHFKKKANNFQIYGHILNNLGVAYKSVNNISKCLEYYEQANKSYDAVSNWMNYHEYQKSKLLTKQNITYAKMDMKQREFEGFTGNAEWLNNQETIDELHENNDDPNYKVWLCVVCVKKCKDAIGQIVKDGNDVKISAMLFLDNIDQQIEKVKAESNAHLDTKYTMLAWCYFHQGMSYNDLRDYKKMAKSNENAIKYLKKLEQVHTLSVYLHCCNNLAFAYKESERYSEAISYFKKALKIHTTVEDWESTIQKNRMKQLVEDNLNQCKVRLALNTTKGQNSKRDKIWFLYHYDSVKPKITGAETNEEKLEMEFKCCKRIYELVDQIYCDGDEARETVLNHMIPKLFECLENAKSFQIEDQNYWVEKVGACLFEIAKVFDKIEDYVQMKGVYIEAEKLFKNELKNPKKGELYAWCMNNIGWGYEANNELDEAKKFYEETIDLMQNHVEWAADGYKSDAIKVPAKSLEIVREKKLSKDVQSDNKWDEAIRLLQCTIETWKEIDNDMVGMRTIANDVFAIVRKMKQHLPLEYYIVEVKKYPLHCMKLLIREIRQSKNTNTKLVILSELHVLCYMFSILESAQDYEELLHMAEHGKNILETTFNDSIYLNYKIYGKCLENIGVAYQHLNKYNKARETYDSLRKFYEQCYFPDNEKRDKYIQQVYDMIQSMESPAEITHKPTQIKETSPEISEMIREKEICQNDIEIDEEERSIKIGSYKFSFSENCLEEETEFNFALTSSTSASNLPLQEYTPVSDIISIESSENVDFNPFVLFVPDKKFCVSPTPKLLKYKTEDSSWLSVEGIKETGIYVQAIEQSSLTLARFKISCVIRMSSSYEMCVALYSTLPTVNQCVEDYLTQTYQTIVRKRFFVEFPSFNSCTLEISTKSKQQGKIQQPNFYEFKTTDICVYPGCIFKFFKFMPSDSLQSNTDVKFDFKINQETKNLKIKWDK